MADPYEGGKTKAAFGLAGFDIATQPLNAEVAKRILGIEVVQFDTSSDSFSTDIKKFLGSGRVTMSDGEPLTQEKTLSLVKLLEDGIQLGPMFALDLAALNLKSDNQLLFLPDQIISNEELGVSMFGYSDPEFFAELTNKDTPFLLQNTESLTEYSHAKYIIEKGHSGGVFMEIVGEYEAGEFLKKFMHDRPELVEDTIERFTAIRTATEMFRYTFEGYDFDGDPEDIVAPFGAMVARKQPQFLDQMDSIQVGSMIVDLDAASKFMKSYYYEAEDAERQSITGFARAARRLLDNPELFEEKLEAFYAGAHYADDNRERSLQRIRDALEKYVISIEKLFPDFIDLTYPQEWPTEKRQPLTEQIRAAGRDPWSLANPEIWSGIPYLPEQKIKITNGQVLSEIIPPAYESQMQQEPYAEFFKDMNPEQQRQFLVAAVAHHNGLSSVHVVDEDQEIMLPALKDLIDPEKTPPEMIALYTAQYQEGPGAPSINTSGIKVGG